MPRCCPSSGEVLWPLRVYLEVGRTGCRVVSRLLRAVGQEDAYSVSHSQLNTLPDCGGAAWESCSCSAPHHPQRRTSCHTTPTTRAWPSPPARSLLLVLLASATMSAPATLRAGAAALQRLRAPPLASDPKAFQPPSGCSRLASCPSLPQTLPPEHCKCLPLGAETAKTAHAELQHVSVFVLVYW